MEARNEKRRNVVASGKTVDEAIANGLGMLSVRRDQVEVEVLSEGSRGVLGFGAENARVRLLVKAPPAPVPRAPVVKEPVPEPRAPVVLEESPPAPEPQPPVVSEEPLPAVESEPEVQELDGSDAGQVGAEILSDILRLMGIRASVDSGPGLELAEEGEPPPTVLNIGGQDLGVLIGRRGETLRTLQYLVRLMVSHRLKHWTDLVVDVEGYRVRRRQALDSLAQRVAERVAKDGRAQALEPMPAYERRLVHIALRNHPQVTTRSVGEGDRRKVTVVPRQ